MASTLFIFLVLVAVGVVTPQNRPTGKEFLDLLPDDITEEDYENLLDEFVEFLQVKDLKDRGDFVDIEYLECTPKLGPYTVPDPDQCDKFYECGTNGRLTEKLCPDGFVYDIPGKSCNHPQRVECKNRLDLQEPEVFPGCPRRNGYFYPDDPLRCNEFTDCVDGLATAGKCSTGLVWSSPILSCTRPEESGRQECVNAVVHDYTCPPVRGALRFGNHDRHRNPDDCGLFFICLVTGTYNKASCEKGKVFSEDAGACLLPEEVEGCEDYFLKDE